MTWWLLLPSSAHAVRVAGGRAIRTGHWLADGGLSHGEKVSYCCLEGKNPVTALHLDNSADMELSVKYTWDSASCFSTSFRLCCLWCIIFQPRSKVLPFSHLIKMNGSIQDLLWFECSITAMLNQYFERIIVLSAFIINSKLRSSYRREWDELCRWVRWTTKTHG